MRKITKVIVDRWAVHPKDLYRFLRLTEKYSKCLYRKDTEYSVDENKDDVIYMVFEAIAISRDLIYKLYVELPTKEVDVLKGTDEEYEELKKPWGGLVPIDERWCADIFPLSNEEVPLYVDVFEYEQFIEVDTIEIED